MGRRWNRKRKAEEGKAKKAKQDQKKAKTGDQSGFNKKPWALSVHENKKMEAYYALQGLHNEYRNKTTGKFVKCETDEQKAQERMRWLDSLRTMLPVSFRIGTDVEKSHREQMELELEEFVGTEMEIVIDPAGGRCGNAFASDEKESTLVTKKIAPAKRIPYIPHAYQLSLDRRTIRRNPALEKFHTWLTTQTSAGFITRQETVSMIPPVVLTVEPHHSVLDMCAAPGSKTSQILEIVSSPTDPKDLEPRGCVVANDSDPKRAFMLVHQLRRINSPAVLVTSCDAQFFPLLKGVSSEQGEGMFDRVLCDVPCSGDGTTRKNPGVWKHWSALGSLALHPLQLSIALNGARLTKVGT
jgi:16S rRNA C967 or C1407 C5-methylase (RsmB/RsmF family)